MWPGHYVAFLVLSSSGLTLVLSQQSFSTQPNDETVLVGNDVTLVCSVSDKQGVLIWSKDGQSLSSDGAINSGVSTTKYSIISDGTTQYDLQISSTTASDGGQYKCEVTAGSTDPSLESNTATLTVEPEQGFTSIPPLRTEKETDSIVLECGTENKAGELEWYRDNNGNLEKISSDTTIIDSSGGRYSITGDTLQGQYYLTISNLQKTDAGEYLCHLTRTGVQPSVWSQRCQLDVEDAIAPGDSYPLCEVPPSPYNEGDNMTVVCRSQGGYPSPQLVWSRDGAELQSEVLATGAGTVRVALQITLDYDFVGTTLMCTSSYQSKSCQVGPLDINLLTRVRVDLTPEILEVEEDESATLVCNATTIENSPPITSYEWYYDNTKINISDPRFSRETLSTKSSTLFILSAQMNMDDAKVACIAKSSIDAQMATASIKIVESTIFGLSYQLLAAVVALVIGIVVALIVVGIIVYCVWKKRQVREEEEEKEIAKTIVENETAVQVAKEKAANQPFPLGNSGMQPYGKDDKYDYYVIYNNSGKHSKSRKHGKHRHSSKGKQNMIVPLNGNPDLQNPNLKRTLPPLPMDVPPPYSPRDDGSKHQRSRRHHRRHSDDYDEEEDRCHHSRRSRSESKGKERRRQRSDDEYSDEDRRRHNRRSRSEPRGEDGRYGDGDYAKPKKRKSKSRDKHQRR